MRVLLAIDESTDAGCSEELLRRVASPETTSITALSVMEQLSAFSYGKPEQEAVREVLDSFRDEQTAALSALVTRLSTAGWSVQSLTRDGHPARELIEAARELRSDLVVVGNRGLTGVPRFLLGSVSQKVLRYAPCSVLMARPREEPGAPLRILLAYDGSEPARRALDCLLEADALEPGELTVVAVHSVQARLRRDRKLREMVERARAALVVEAEEAAERLGRRFARVSVVVREGAPSHEILEVAREVQADLIVLGDRGRDAGYPFLLGSVSSRIPPHATCSVWLVRQPIGEKAE